MLWVMLFACTSVEDFEEDYAIAACEKVYIDCYSDEQLEFFPWDDLDDCLENKEPDIALPAEDCDFDPRAARDCVDETTALECEDFRGGRFPAVCYTVCGGEAPE